MSGYAPSMEWMTVVSVAHLVGTLGMFGVILVVQIVHYPLMDRVGEERAAEYARAHTDRMGFVVGPLMVPEMGAAIWLALVPPTAALASVAWVGLGMLAVIWSVTGLVSVPCHARLVRGWDGDTHRRLVASNWVRTLLWGARVPVALMLAGIV